VSAYHRGKERGDVPFPKSGGGREADRGPQESAPFASGALIKAGGKKRKRIVAFGGVKEGIKKKKKELS